MKQAKPDIFLPLDFFGQMLELISIQLTNLVTPS